MSTLAPAATAAMPNLLGVPCSYDHEVNAELLFQLCAELARLGVGRPELWKECGGSAVRFAEESLRSAIGQSTLNILRENVEYHLTISDELTAYGESPELGPHMLAISIECSGAGYLKLGSALAYLEGVEAGLAEAFYWVLLSSLHRVMRIYDHTDAEQYEEQIRDYAQEEPEDTGPFEFPEVAKAIPSYIERSIARTRFPALVQCLRRHTELPWVNRVLTIHRLARVRQRDSEELRERGQYDAPPLPCVLISFEEHDAIVACFDEEAQSMLEGISEPTLLVGFDMRNGAEQHRALRSVQRFLAVSRELFELGDSIRSWEKQHADARIDRTEPAL